jgi:hypothetical protein
MELHGGADHGTMRKRERTMLNRELFVEDPTEREIPNLGVAKVLNPESDEEYTVLRYELTHFVCEGEYEAGLQRILESFIRNLDKDAQPSAWVSGFYGSGKSHLVRVLQYLWTDYAFPDGSTAQGLVTLPSSVSDPLGELRTAGKREGGLWAAAGTLGAGAGDSVRLAFLGIVLRAAGLPEKLEPARFVLWLHEQGLLDGVRSSVEAAGKEWGRELRSLYVSPVIADALLQARPGFASSAAEARSLLKTQYPPVSDISDEEFLAVLRSVLEMQSQKEGRLPLTLIVLDELQQYINDNVERMLDVQNVVEACCTTFDSTVLVVSTGQSALQATPVLQKLQDRFTVRVALSDTDVDSVVRRVVLQKRADKIDVLRSTLDQVSGEIDRHLAGSKIAPTGEDGVDLVPLYPILPSRQRFWERVLRSIDPGGNAGQLRTQLRTVHEATRAVAQDHVGFVVGGDFIYGQQATGMLETGVMPRETYNEIDGLKDGTEEGDFRSELAALVFLVSKLPTDPGADSGVRPTAEMVADLLVEDLQAPSSDLRKRVSSSLGQMVQEGLLNEVDGEYRLLTKESANWQTEYQKRLAGLKNDNGRIASDRDATLKTAVAEVLRKIAPLHGKSKTARKVQVSFGQAEPPDDKVSIPIWIRDGWETTEKSVRNDAVQAGTDSARACVFLPRQDDETLRTVLAERAASSDTIDGRPAPTTSEGQEARAAMESRKAAAEARLSTIAMQVLRSAKVFQGGGNEIARATLEESVAAATDAGLDRRFPQFSLADHPEWGKVIQRAREGNAQPLAPVGDTGEVTQNPVCKEVLSYLPGSWTKGAEVRKHFMEAPFGWPQDAIDGALVALVGSGALGARQNGEDVAVKNLNPGSLSKTEFRKEISVVTAAIRVAVRGLMAEVGLKVDPGDEAPSLHTYLDQLATLASTAGGEAPLPASPDTSEIKRLRKLSGNDLIAEVHAKMDDLRSSAKRWTRDSELAGSRLPSWSRLNELLRFAEGLAFAGGVAEQAAAVEAGRRLLDDPDPMTPLTTALCDGLREAVLAAHERFTDAFTAGQQQLATDPQWQQLKEEGRSRILSSVGLVATPAPEVGTEDELLTALRQSTVSEWADRAAAIPAKVAQARETAAKELIPKATTFVPPDATLHSADDVKAYVAELQEELLRRIVDGPVII